MHRKLAFLKKKLPSTPLKPLVPWVISLSAASLAVWGLWFFVGELPRKNIPSALSEKEKRELINSNRDNVLKVIQTLAGLGFIGTAYLAWRNSQLTEDKNVTDRFTKAVEMLSDKERLEMRLGGIYALERIAKDSKADHPVVMEVLTAFIREKTTTEDYKQLQTTTADIQSALDVIGRRIVSNDLRQINLFEANLQGADLRGANLQRIVLEGANLQEAVLDGTNLQLAFLSKVNLQGADLRGANLQGTVLEEANLQGAVLDGANLYATNLGNANLQRANLRNANLQKAYLGEVNLQAAILEKASLHDAVLVVANLQEAFLVGANFQKAFLEGANFQKAFLEGANFQKANLRNANLHEATGITENGLDSAELCRTVLPKNINLDQDRDCPA
jgi:uncharacterized protein YjbI with pentapeptide repeats